MNDNAPQVHRALTDKQLELFNVIYIHKRDYNTPLTLNFLCEVFPERTKPMIIQLLQKIDGKGWIDYNHSDITVTEAGNAAFQAHLARRAA